MEFNIDILLLVLLSGICEFVHCELVLRGPEDNCTLWTPPTFGNLKDNDRVDIGPLSSLLSVRPVQIGVYTQSTDWMRYEGCILQLYNGPCTHRLSGQTDPIIECYEHCNKTTFSLFDKCCYCHEFIIEAMTTCTAKQCFPMYNGICGETFGDPNSGCFCQYRPIELSIRRGISNCLAVFHSYNQNIRLLHVNCKSEERYFGVRGSLRIEYLEAPWWTAALTVQNAQYFFANETDLQTNVILKEYTLYWVGIFRKQKLVRKQVNEAEFCGALHKDMEGMVRFSIQICNVLLPKLCEINDEFPSVSHTTALIPGTKSAPNDGIPEVNHKPEVNNMPKDGHNGISIGAIITIVSSIVSLIIVLIIFFAFVKRKTKSSRRVMDMNVSNENSPPVGNVYNSLMYIGRSRDDDYSQLNTEDQRVVYHEIRDNTDMNNYEDVN